jgi:hypothetical protein
MLGVRLGLFVRFRLIVKSFQSRLHSPFLVLVVRARIGAGENSADAKISVRVRVNVRG